MLIPRHYAGHARRYYIAGYHAGVADDRTERFFKTLGTPGDRYTEECVNAWTRGFQNGQRSIGLEPDKTYCSKEEYPGAEGPKLREEAERKLREERDRREAAQKAAGQPDGGG